MPLKSNDGRKYSDVNLSANSRSTSEYNETKLAARSMIDIHQQQVNPARKPNLAVPKITHHKLDSDKSAQAAVHEKVERLGTFCFHYSLERFCRYPRRVLLSLSMNICRSVRVRIN